MTAWSSFLERVRSSPRSSRIRHASFFLVALATASLFALYSRVESPWFLLGFVALVPWLFALERAATLIEAAGAGVAMSVTFVALVFSWLPGAAERYSGASQPLLWLLLILLGPIIEPQFISFAVARHLARRGGGRYPALRAALAAACAYVATELFAPKLFFDTMGEGLYPWLTLCQAADLAGIHGLTLLLLLVNEGVFATLQRWTNLPEEGAATSALGAVPGGHWRSRAGRVLSPLACALGLIGAALGYGYSRLAEVRVRSKAPGVDVGVVQANITNYDKLRAEKGAFEAVRTILDMHYALSDELRAGAPPDLLVWPETVYPTTFGSPKSEAGKAFDQEIAAFVSARGVPLVFGAYDVEAEREYNAAFFLTAAEGGRLSSSTYRKTMLFPLTEWVPEVLDSAWLRRLLPWLGSWERGPGPRIIDLRLREGKAISVVPLICYDAVFPAFVAEAAQKGADLIVTLSNDSWFPDDRAPRLHLISAAFRSIETRLPQVRATNSGISAMIAPTGEILATAGWGERRALSANLPNAGRMVTPAVAYRKLFGRALLSLFVLLLLPAAAHGLRARRGPKSQPSKPQSKRRMRTYAETSPK